MITEMNWGTQLIPLIPSTCSCGCSCGCSCDPVSQRAGLAAGTAGGLTVAISSTSGAVVAQPN